MQKLVFVGLILMLSISACSDLQSLDNNPNSVSQTPPHLLLTQIESNAFQVKGLSPLFASRMVISTSGENELQYYKWNRGSFDEYNELRDVTKMMQEAKRVSKPVYTALGHFLRAYYFYNLTLRFGDIPYSKALQGESQDVYAPAYDTQKKVFQGILDELKTANQTLADNPDVIEGDVIYAGDVTKWRKLVNSFRLKILLTLSKQVNDPDLNIKSRFANIVANQPIIASNDDNGQLVFYDQIGSQYGEYNSSTYSSDIYVDSTFIKRLQDRKDPRLFIYAQRTGNAKDQGLAVDDFSAYEGGNPVGQYSNNIDKASAGNISLVSARYYTDPTNEPHVVLGYSEVQLILAEAKLRGWLNATDAETNYKNAIRADFSFYKKNAEKYSSYVDAQAADTYLQNSLVKFASSDTQKDKIRKVMMQKYLRSFEQGGWTVYYEELRTGYPTFLQPQTGPPPTRWIYPQSEYQNNNKNVTDAITRQFGAGNDKIRAVPWWLK